MKKHLSLFNGFVRFKSIELNWSIYDWALPLSIDIQSKYMIIIRLLCVSIIIFKNK